MNSAICTISMTAKIHWQAVAFWLAASLTEAVVLARMAAWAERTLVASPFSPILLGAACGMATAVLANFFNHVSAALARWGTLAVAMVAIAASHLFYYLDYRAEFSQTFTTKGDPLVMKIVGHAQPASFGEFMATAAQRQFGVLPGWLWWIVGGGLTIVACVAVGTLMWRGNDQGLAVNPQADGS
jgi:hypothetical protein